MSLYRTIKRSSWRECWIWRCLNMENVLDDFICPFTEMYTFNAHFKIVDYMCVRVFLCRWHTWCDPIICAFLCIGGFLLLFFHDLWFHLMWGLLICIRSTIVACSFFLSLSLSKLAIILRCDGWDTHLHTHTKRQRLICKLRMLERMWWEVTQFMKEYIDATNCIPKARWVNRNH